jgi:tetratricopeptide (TPR) repeat protein
LLSGLAVVAFAIIHFETCRAGLYHPAEPLLGPQVTKQGVQPLPFRLFHGDAIEDLTNIGVPQSKLREKYLERRDELQAKARRGRLSEQDAVNLSAYLIRLRQYQEAIDVLTPLATRDCRNYMVFANLATAEQLTGQLPRAFAHLQQAMDIWPRRWPGLNPEQLDWFAQVEKYHLRLLRLRAREGKSQAESVDALFGKDGNPVRFVGESGQFEPSQLAAAEKEKLPTDAVAILQQLLVWLPDDTRLYWQLGELYNANGDLESAYKVFDDCIWKYRFETPELKAHRQMLAEALESQSPVQATGAQSWLPETRKIILWGGVFGLIVAALAYLQIREFRRRRKLGIGKRD